MQIVGAFLVVAGFGLLAWFIAAQRTAPPARHSPPAPTTASRARRRRVRFGHALELTASPMSVPDGRYFALAPEDRGVGRRLAGIAWLIVLIAVLAAALAGGLWAIGRVITEAVTSYFESGA